MTPYFEGEGWDVNVEGTVRIKRNFVTDPNIVYPVTTDAAAAQELGKHRGEKVTRMLGDVSGDVVEATTLLRYGLNHVHDMTALDYAEAREGVVVLGAVELES